jgi:HSP20 family molecular chaperone IbpA
MRTSASFLSSDLNANPHPLELAGSAEGQEMEEELKKRIAERAYQIYEQTGRTAGEHQEHWLLAEREVVQRITQIRESGPWVIVNLNVPNVPAEGFKLLITEEKALVEVEEPAAQRKPPQERAGRLLFYTARWPMQVEPGTASAYVKNGTMTLEVKLRTKR